MAKRNTATLIDRLRQQQANRETDIKSTNERITLRKAASAASSELSKTVQQALGSRAPADHAQAIANSLLTVAERLTPLEPQNALEAMNALGFVQRWGRMADAWSNEELRDAVEIARELLRLALSGGRAPLEQQLAAVLAFPTWVTQALCILCDRLAGEDSLPRTEETQDIVTREVARYEPVPLADVAPDSPKLVHSSTEQTASQDINLSNLVPAEIDAMRACLEWCQSTTRSLADLGRALGSLRRAGTVSQAVRRQCISDASRVSQKTAALFQQWFCNPGHRGIFVRDVQQRHDPYFSEAWGTVRDLEQHLRNPTETFKEDRIPVVNLDALFLARDEIKRLVDLLVMAIVEREQMSSPEVGANTPTTERAQATTTDSPPAAPSAPPDLLEGRSGGHVLSLSRLVEEIDRLLTEVNNARNHKLTLADLVPVAARHRVITALARQTGLPDPPPLDLAALPTYCVASWYTDEGTRRTQEYFLPEMNAPLRDASAAQWDLEMSALREAARLLCETPPLQEEKGQPTGGAQTLRLAVDKDRAIVLLDGKEVFLDMTPEKRADTLCYLGHLIKAAGQWLSGTEISRAERRPDTRWDRIKSKLPETILALIETDRRKGSRLTAAAWR